MTRIIVVRPGATDFDQQGRIKGTLDIPLNDDGNDQAAQAARELSDQDIEAVYCSPCQSARQTAELLAEALRLRVKELQNLKNLNHGLWQGKLIEELKEKQRKVYRQWQDQPETVCPPEGEMVSEAQSRVKSTVDKLVKKHKNQIIALVAPEPLATLIRSYLQQTRLGDLWESECVCGSWESIEVEPRQLATMAPNTP